MTSTNSLSTTRRGALRSLGAALGLSGLVRGVTGAETPAALLVFVYDDSPIQDYRKAFPVHHEEGAPACIAAVTDIIAGDTGLNPAHLREVQADGWEVMSHTNTHRAMGRMRLSAPVAPDDERLYLPYNYHGVTPGGPLLVDDGDRTVEVPLVGRGRDDDGPYLDLDAPVGASFAAEGTYVRFPDRVLEAELTSSKRRLEAMGLEIDNFVYPFGSHGPHVDRLVRRYYDGVGNWHRDGLNPGVGVDPYRIGRSYFRTDMHTVGAVGAWLDEVAAGDHLGMLAGHAYLPTITAERIRATIRMARARGIEIVTLREAFRRRGLDREEDGRRESGDDRPADNRAATGESTDDEPTDDRELNDGAANIDRRSEPPRRDPSTPPFGVGLRR